MMTPQFGMCQQVLGKTFIAVQLCSRVKSKVDGNPMNYCDAVGTAVPLCTLH